MGHVCLHIWKIYVNIMLNQSGHMSEESGKCLEKDMYHMYIQEIYMQHIL